MPAAGGAPPVGSALLTPPGRRGSARGGEERSKAGGEESPGSRQVGCGTLFRGGGLSVLLWVFFLLYGIDRAGCAAGPPAVKVAVSPPAALRCPGVRGSARGGGSAPSALPFFGLASPAGRVRSENRKSTAQPSRAVLSRCGCLHRAARLDVPPVDHRVCRCPGWGCPYGSLLSAWLRFWARALL